MRRGAMWKRQSGVNEIKEHLREIETQRDRARSIVAKYEAEISRSVDEGIDAGLQAIRRRTKKEIDNADRLVDKNTCEYFVRRHVVPFGADALQIDIASKIEEAGNKMSDELDNICQRMDTLSFGDLEVSPAGHGALIGETRRVVVSGSAKYLAQTYLTRLGGAAGAKAGVVNFSKMSVSKVGRVFGKKFSRQFYNGMGQLLKRFGLTTSRALRTFAVVVVEFVEYVYTVATWKRSVLAAVNYTLGLPVQDEPILDKLKRNIPIISQKTEPFGPLMHREYQAAVSKLIQDTRELLEEDFSRRLEVFQPVAKESSTNAEEELRRLDRIDNTLADLKQRFMAIADGAEKER